MDSLEVSSLKCIDGRRGIAYGRLEGAPGALSIRPHCQMPTKASFFLPGKPKLWPGRRSYLLTILYTHLTQVTPSIVYRQNPPQRGITRWQRTSAVVCRPFHPPPTPPPPSRRRRRPATVASVASVGGGPPLCAGAAARGDSIDPCA